MEIRVERRRVRAPRPRQRRLVQPPNCTAGVALDLALELLRLILALELLQLNLVLLLLYRRRQGPILDLLLDQSLLLALV